jgi:polysaccharide export outer membrane protein
MTIIVKRRISIFLILLCCAGVCAAQGQDPLGESIKIGPADTLHIRVLEAPELEQTVRVTDAGTVPLIAGGDIKLQGLTPGEAASAVAERLRDRDLILHPHVSVSLDQAVTQVVSVVGQVKNPGAFAIGTPRTALQVIALAGGLTDTANRTITIQRRGTNEHVRYNLSNNANAAIREDVMVYPGDTVVISKADIVYLLGDVNKPGGYPISTNDSEITILEAVAIAGGTPPTAVPNDARLIRRQPDGSRVEMPIKLSDMQKGSKPDIPMEPDDILYVPFSYARNALLGIASLVSAASSAAIYAVH